MRTGQVHIRPFQKFLKNLFITIQNKRNLEKSLTDWFYLKIEKEKKNIETFK